MLQHFFKLVNAHALVVAVDGNKTRLVTAEGLNRRKVTRVLDYDRVAGFQENLADEIDALLRARRYHHVIRACRDALRLHSRGDPFSQDLQPSVVLYCNAVAASSANTCA